MSRWEKLLEDQQKQRINVIAELAFRGFTKSEAADYLGVSRQAIQQFSKLYNIKFVKIADRRSEDGLPRNMGGNARKARKGKSGPCKVIE